jgi:hypothetical protein
MPHEAEEQGKFGENRNGRQLLIDLSHERLKATCENNSDRAVDQAEIEVSKRGVEPDRTRRSEICSFAISRIIIDPRQVCNRSVAFYLP